MSETGFSQCIEKIPFPFIQRNAEVSKDGSCGALQ